MYRHVEIRFGKHGGQASMWSQENSRRYQISFLLLHSKLAQLSDLKQHPFITSVL